jgi:outer membrane lipoprotein
MSCRISFVVPCRLLAAVASLALAACASPVFKDAAPAAVSPAEVALQPGRHEGAVVVWGGKILDVRNLAETTEIQVAAYPLDRSQRPQQTAPIQGRFIVLLPGFAEPLDFPPGRFITVRGHIDGSRLRRIGDADREYPAVRRDELHVWPVNFPRERSRASFGVGIGVGIR